MANDKKKLPSSGEVFKMLSFLPLPLRILAVMVVVVIGVFWTVVQNVPNKPSTPSSSVASTKVDGELVFTSWNVANFFDDQDDPGNNDEDEDFYARNPQAFRAKVSQLADGLLQINDGNGPDVITMVEVESDLCMTALKDAANAKLKADGKGELVYTDIIFRSDNSGRRFAPGVMSRIKCDNNRSARFGARSNGRQLITRLMANGHELVILGAHWTSRVSDRDGSRRNSYAQDTYGMFKEVVTANADADVIVCGDFNDEFQDVSMQRWFHASDDVNAVRAATPPDQDPLILVLTALLPKNIGTICYQNKPQTFDHICVSRGLLDDKGWNYVKDSIAVFSNEAFAMRNGCPRRFNPEQGTGYSDHFPVTARFRVEK